MLILESLDAVKIDKTRMAYKGKRDNYKFSNPSVVNGIGSSWSWISTRHFNIIQEYNIDFTMWTCRILTCVCAFARLFMSIEHTH